MIVSLRIPALDMRTTSFSIGLEKWIEERGCGVWAAAREAPRASIRIAERVASFFMLISTPPEPLRFRRQGNFTTWAGFRAVRGGGQPGEHLRKEPARRNAGDPADMRRGAGDVRGGMSGRGAR